MKAGRILRLALTLAFSTGLLLWTGCDQEHDHSSHKHGAQETPTPSGTSATAQQEPAGKPYPLKTCVVSGEELGKMGEPKRIVYEGQEVRFCCPSCEKDFRKEPAKFLKKIEDARKGS